VKALHQLVAAATPGDAVTEQALAWQRLIRGWGMRSEVIAEHVHPALENEVHALWKARRLLDEGGVILRYSIWSAAAEAALEVDGPRVLVYHNITPGDLLREHNPAIAALCDQGRHELPRLCGRFDPVIADSSFNGGELEALGFGGAQVVPLLLDLPEHQPLRPASAEPRILSVGRVVPSKRLENVVGAFALYQRRHMPAARLELIGPSDGFDSYRYRLEALVRRSAVQNVSITGWLSDGELRQRYLSADAYVCLSAHEGFGAPLVEAMAYGVPVVASDNGAIRETLGQGLVLDGSDLPLVSEALHEVISSPQTREGLHILAGRRLRELRPEAVAERVRVALEPTVQAL
jgi:glycosyltransferase involved in cell wall biosynthesis